MFKTGVIMTNLTRKMSCLFVLLSLFAVNNYILGVGEASAPVVEPKSPTVKEQATNLEAKLGGADKKDKDSGEKKGGLFSGLRHSKKTPPTAPESNENAQRSKFKKVLDLLGNRFSTGTDYIVGKPLDSPWLLLAWLSTKLHINQGANKVNKKMIQPSYNFFGTHITAIKRTITLALVIATCFYLLRKDKLAAVESGKQAESETKLAQLVTNLSEIEEKIENLKKENGNSDELNKLNILRNSLLDAIYETYKENTPLLKRTLNACRLGTFLGVAPYDEEENLIEDEETA